MSDQFIDAGEVQALIQYHAKSIVECVEDEGIKPSQQPVLVKTAERIVELANRLAEFKPI